MWASLKTIAERFGLILPAICFVGILRHFALLSFDASIFFGGASVVIAWWIYLLFKAATFQPYRLIIGVNYDVIREDFRLAATPDPKFENFTFHALTASLFARSDGQEYSSELYIFKEVPCSSPTWTPGVGEIRKQPEFFFRPAQSGYQFGLHVNEPWWEVHKKQLKPPTRTLSANHNGTLVLGCLPYGYFPDHVRRWNEPASVWYPFNLRQRRWMKRLQESGWGFDENLPEYLRHRYIVVSFHRI